MYSKIPKQGYFTQISYKGGSCILASCTIESPPYIVWVL